MRFAISTRVGTAFLAAVVLSTLPASTALAQDQAASLDRAIELFNQADYIAAQEVLVGIDRDALTDEQRAVRDEYLNRVQVAINMAEKALREFEDAQIAIDEGEHDAAVDLLERVLANEYADDALRRSASASLLELQRAGAGRTPPPAAQPAAGDTTQPGAAAAAQRARILTQEADDMVRAARYDEARRLYEEALSAVPGYPEAIEGLQRVQEHERTLNGERRQSLIDRIRRQDAINWQRTVAEYRDTEKIVREHVENNRFPEAQQFLIRARQIVDAGKQFADPVTKYESLRDELETLVQFVDARERQFNEDQVAAMRREIEEQRKRHLQEVEEKRRRQREALMDQAVQHRKDGDLDAAINVLEQVMVIDPTYQPARWMADDLDDLREYKRSRRLRDQFYNQARKTLNDVEESKIPWHEQLRYPKNWPEIIAQPTRNLPGVTSNRSQLWGALDKKLPVDFRDDPFDQVMERLADAGGVNVIVNWNDLEHVGVDRTVPIDLSLPRDISLKKALTEVLEQAGGGLVEVGFDVGEDAVKIATRATLDKQTYTAVYDINDLLMEIPIFNDAPMTDLRVANQRAARAAVEVPEQPWRYGDDDDDEPEEDPQRSGRARRIIELIQNTVAPDSWRENGGTIGTIEEINGQLVVTQNSAGQQQVGDLLGKLREQRAVQIAVEARFITVSSHYLEELGIDLDIVLNSGNAGYDYMPSGSGPLTDPVLGNTLLLPRSYSRLGFAPAAPVTGTNLQTGAAATQPYQWPFFVPQNSGGAGGRSGTPVPIINRVTAFTDTSSLGSDVPGSFAGQTIGSAFSLFGSFLDNIQVDFLIRATQADSRTSVLTAPRLVLFNGQRSWVAVTIQQNYVSQLNPIVGTGAVAQQPTTATIDSGAVLDVAATVSADRRYVTMTVRPGVTRLLDLQTIPFSGGGAGGGFGGGAANQAFLQLPTLSTQRVQTTVSVPDGGTLLIGGQKLASEQEIEAGVPILSKIPVLKRLYSSRSMVKDEQTLLILIKPKVLIQTEQEELAFPSFSQG
ncbi:MAG: hypothetical protein PVI86_12585 [Phycisphaerae bacterium]